MADATVKPRLLKVAELFERYGVQFIVLGGEAAVLHGSPLPTYDTDLCYRRTLKNLECLASALREIHPTLRGASDQTTARKAHILNSRTSPVTVGVVDASGFGESVANAVSESQPEGSISRLTS